MGRSREKEEAMTTTTPKHRIAALVSVIGALLILGGTAQAAASKPAGMSNAEYRALMIRSQALNDRYGLGWPAQKPELMTVAELRAIMLRSQALNDKYGLGGSAVAAPITRPQPAVAGPTTRPEPAVIATDAFAWGDFGIGAAAMLGLVLLVAGLIAGGRLGRGVLRARSSS
jgi:hypothetical protein